MKVKCVICDQIEELDSDSVKGKKLRHHPLATFVCQPCYNRITVNTEKRKSEGKLKSEQPPLPHDQW